MSRVFKIVLKAYDYDYDIADLATDSAEQMWMALCGEVASLWVHGRTPIVALVKIYGGIK
jgi:hypothetical protein